MSLYLHSYLLPLIGYLLILIIVSQLLHLIKVFTIVVSLFACRLHCSILSSIIFTLFTHTKYINYRSCCLSCLCICCLLVTPILVVALSVWLVRSRLINSMIRDSLHHSLISLWDSLILALSLTVISVISIWLLFIGSIHMLLVVFTLRLVLVNRIFINCVTIILLLLLGLHLQDNTSYYLPRFMIILVWLGGILVVFVYVTAIVPNRYATPYSLGLMLLLLVITITLSLTLDNVVPSSRLNTIAINTTHLVIG